MKKYKFVVDSKSHLHFLKFFLSKSVNFNGILWTFANFLTYQILFTLKLINYVLHFLQFLSLLVFLLSLQSNQEKVWKFPKFSTDTYWLEGELHYIKYLKEAFILRPIKLFYQCLLSVIKNFLKFKKKIKSSLRYFWKKCDLFTPLFSQKNLIRIQSLRYIFLVLSIPIWVQWWLKFSTPLW